MMQYPSRDRNMSTPFGSPHAILEERMLAARQRVANLNRLIDHTSILAPGRSADHRDRHLDGYAVH